jgi:hypothetical protein
MLACGKNRRSQIKDQPWKMKNLKLKAMHKTWRRVFGGEETESAISFTSFYESDFAVLKQLDLAQSQICCRRLPRQDCLVRYTRITSTNYNSTIYDVKPRVWSSITIFLRELSIHYILYFCPKDGPCSGPFLDVPRWVFLEVVDRRWVFKLFKLISQTTRYFGKKSILRNRILIKNSFFRRILLTKRNSV